MSSPFNEAKYKELLEGLEISEISYNFVVNENDWHRFDSEYYKKQATNVINSIKRKPYTTIGKCFDVSKLAGFEFTDYFTSENMQSNDYYIALTSKNIQSERLDLSDYITIDKKVADKNLQRSKLLFEDVILSYTGEYRRALVLQDNRPFQLGPNICRIRAKSNQISPYYLSAFLNSKIGQIILDKEKTLSAQPTVAMSRIRQIPIPIVKHQEYFCNIIKKAYNNLVKSEKIYNVAENQLLSELGLNDWQPDNNPINIKQLKDSYMTSGRLDAEYYQPKYEEIEKQIKQYKNGVDIVSNLFQQNIDICNYKESAYNYIEIGDINIENASASFSLIPTNELPDNAKRVVHKGNILISKVRPYRGAVSIIDFDDTNLIASGAFTVLHEKTNYKKEVLLTLLRLKIYKDWLLKWNVGSSYPVIKDEDILNLPIPLIPNSIQLQIEKLIQESSALKAESKRLLDEAKQMVERAIENNGFF